MATLNISMPDDLRAFIDARTREGGFQTPTEYVRSLIREDRRKREQEMYGPLISKWLIEGELSDEEMARLPAGLMDRVKRNLQKMIQEGIDSGPGEGLTDERLDRLVAEARDRVKNRR